jgi:hypothetical protein
VKTHSIPKPGSTSPDAVWQITLPKLAVMKDTVNDGRPFTFKTDLPLDALDQTGPWSWHGWQQDASQAMKHSLKTTMLGPEPTEHAMYRNVPCCVERLTMQSAICIDA